MSDNMSLKLAAREAGQRFYDTGKPCKYGHISKRYASTGGCFICLSGRSMDAPSLTQAAYNLKLWIPVAMTQAQRESLELYLVRAAQAHVKHLGHVGLPMRAVDENLEECHKRGLPWANRLWK